uniref:Uncharacterized protein n=1 Tax=Panagrolaimus sp. PS1159 TaxID=55785 RepID=A0AC35F8A5_9BILA
MVDPNADDGAEPMDVDCDQQNDSAKTPKRKRKTKKSQASQAAARRKTDKMKRQSEPAAYSAGVLSSARMGELLKSQQLTQQQINKLPKHRRPPTTAENRAEALKPKRPIQEFQVIADVTQNPTTVQNDVIQSSQIHQPTQQQSNTNANVDSNVSLSTQIHQ